MKEWLLIVSCIAFIESFAQTKPILVQLSEKSKLRNEKEIKEKIDVIISVTRNTVTLPDSYIIKAKLIGANSALLLDFPDSLLEDIKTFRVIEAVYVASNEPIIPVPEVFGEFEYQPIEFNFKTVPDNATLFLIPLIDWESMFKTPNISSVKIKSNDLEKLQTYEVTKQKTPLTYPVFEQPYVGIFVRESIIKKVFIQPKRKVPEDNVVTITLN